MSNITIIKADGSKTVVPQSHFGKPRLKNNMLFEAKKSTITSKNIYKDILAKIATSILQRKLSISFVEIYMLSELLKKVGLYKLALQLKTKSTTWCKNRLERLERRGLNW